MSSDPTRVACVGGSITFGLGLTNRRVECYPTVLGGLLGESFVVRNFGYSGAAVGRRTNEPYWRTPSFTAVERFDPQQVVLALGTNDAQHANQEALGDFAAEYRALVAHFRALPSVSPVLLATPPPVFEPLPEISIPTLDNVIRPAIVGLSAELTAPLIDLYGPLAGRPELFPDNLHPNAEGSRIIAQQVALAVTG